MKIKERKVRKDKGQPHKFHKGSRASKIIELVEGGEELTIHEIAKRLRCPWTHVSVALGALRRKGYMYHPVGGVKKKGQFHMTKGFVVDVTKKPGDYLEVQQRYDRDMDAKVNTSFRTIEKVWLEFPELRDKIETTVNTMTMRLISNKEHIKKLK